MTSVVDRLELPSAVARASLKDGPIHIGEFRRAFASFACLTQIEQVAPPAPPAPPASARILFWNAERLKYPAPSATLLGASHADAILLCEVDLGMARSGNRHTIADVARVLDAGYVYAAEFVELDLGDARERKWHADVTNAAGLHGAGLVSTLPLERPDLVRLEESGRWFDGAFGERRVGGRIAIMAELALARGKVLLVSVHYESHTGPADRLAQTEVLLDAIDRCAPALPVLIGGDFNTSTFELPISTQPVLVAAALREDPDRLLLPMRYEPMFEELARRGYGWEACNVMGVSTQRTRPDGTPPPPFGRIDWFFARGLDCSDAAMISAVDDAGVAISDHEALAVTIRIPGA
jgi:endonuclease/exonuclease/phosphatase family metal-dependent hydrolase